MKSFEKKRKGMTKWLNESWGDKVFDIVCNLFLILFVVIVFYPVYFVLIASFTDPSYVNNGTLLLYPKEPSLAGYIEVFRDKRILVGYANTIFYTVCGTALGVMVTMMAGFALSRKDLPGSSVIMKLFVFTMYFGGGMIPMYLVIKNLGMLNNRLTLIILGSVSVYNIIVVRSFMQSSIPEDLSDAAEIDGCGCGRFFFQIVLPLSKAVMAVIALYIAVGHWNSYFNAMMYMSDDKKYPLQVYLREILLLTSAAAGASDLDPEVLSEMQSLVEVIRYSVIVVSTLPILCVYPFIQKYFVKGVMIGSVKG